ncbi:MAG: hypothetical protein C7K11_02185 [Candidatus Amulumruptor caecigallinarius]|uniref:Yip1 domain-containing protein n=2 Tax=Pseudomonadati TaxID=3379134 RepID=A0A4Q0UA85_9BACT|nr:MAG: hypothetical protein C7K11_02185 [Candidatus Amulumruptor caecigallinarius]HJE39082.1 hypothetical protein [Candidatus Amulumruptor caecigallinarius]
MLQLILSPRNGWEDISLDDDRRTYPTAASYYTFIGVVAASWIVQWAYHPDYFHVAKLIELVIVTYAVFFVCYFVGTFVMSVALETLVKPGIDIDEHRTRTFTLYALALLSAVLLLGLLLPATTPVIWFLPLYVLVIMWKGARYLRISKHKIRSFVTTALLGVLVPPMLLGLLFKYLLL